MIVVREVDISDVRQHEDDTGANVRLGGYEMDHHSPTNQFRCFQVQLERQDEDRTFLLGLTAFISQTRDKSCRVQDVVAGASAIERVASFISAKVDLRSHAGLELVLVAPRLMEEPLIVIDGNHRAMSQFLCHKSVDGVPAFACVHPAILQWPLVPPVARTFKRPAKQSASAGGGV